MITEDQHLQLQNVAYQFEHGSFGHPEFEDVMQRVFGGNRTGMDATEWRNYWNALTIYCEKIGENDLTAEKPMAS
jgi:hypothetical protein